VFGGVRRSEAHLRGPERAAGFLECERADVSWFLSVDRNDLPEDVKGNKTTFRSVTVDGEEVESWGPSVGARSASASHVANRVRAL